MHLLPSLFTFTNKSSTQQYCWADKVLTVMGLSKPLSFVQDLQKSLGQSLSLEKLIKRMLQKAHVNIKACMLTSFVPSNNNVATASLFGSKPFSLVM